jgi:hypothetical protein
VKNLFRGLEIVEAEMENDPICRHAFGLHKLTDAEAIPQ